MKLSNDTNGKRWEATDWWFQWHLQVMRVRPARAVVVVRRRVLLPSHEAGLIASIIESSRKGNPCLLSITPAHFRRHGAKATNHEPPRLHTLVQVSASRGRGYYMVHTHGCTTVPPQCSTITINATERISRPIAGSCGVVKPSHLVQNVWPRQSWAHVACLS